MSRLWELTKWEWCPAAEEPVLSNQLVHLDGDKDGLVRSPEWPGEGCCEYGHKKLYYIVSSKEDDE